MILLRGLGVISHINGLYWKKIDIKFERSYLCMNICKQELVDLRNWKFNWPYHQSFQLYSIHVFLVLFHFSSFSLQKLWS